MSGIRVHIVREKDRPNWVMRYHDSVGGRQIKRSSGTPNRKAALKKAGEWEALLNADSAGGVGVIRWESFRERYEDEHARSLARRTLRMIGSVLNALERITPPGKLAEVNEAKISRFQAVLRREGKSEQTIRSYLAHLRGALSWAVEQKLIRQVPKFPKVQRGKASKQMKGRPITSEEFERMLQQTESVVGKDAAPTWEYFLRGLWWSGLRISEAVNLFWGGTEGLVVSGIDRQEPLLEIPAQQQKNNTTQSLPVAPEFVGILRQTPKDQRHGRVFKLQGVTVPRPQGGGNVGKEQLTDPEWVSKVIGRIGKKARVVVDQKPPRREGEKPRIKYASAHDLRRAFGERWADRVDAQVLMELMRHEDIETTLRFYVGRNARRTSRTLWRAYHREMEERLKVGNRAPSEASEHSNQSHLGTVSGTADQDSPSDCGSRNDESYCSARA